MLSLVNSLHKLFLRGQSDSYWASDPNDRRSMSGSCVYFNQNLISWNSKKQPLMTRSSAKVEYQTLTHTTSKLIYGLSHSYLNYTSTIYLQL